MKIAVTWLLHAARTGEGHGMKIAVTWYCYQCERAYVWNPYGNADDLIQDLAHEIRKHEDCAVIPREERAS